jgi:hypothetical protein
LIDRLPDYPITRLPDQLAAIVDGFDSARARLHALAQDVPDDVWPRRRDPARWSVAECVAHLNLTSRAFLPLVREGIEEARRRPPVAGHGRYRRDFVGWVLWSTSGPPVRIRVKTTAAFVPTGTEPRIVLMSAFDELQARQVECVRDASGLPIDRVRITSPFDARVKYNLYACLTILPRHQHRHLWQAEQVWQSVLGTGARKGG